jgi:hypothetical protein
VDGTGLARKHKSNSQLACYKSTDDEPASFERHDRGDASSRERSSESRSDRREKVRIAKRVSKVCMTVRPTERPKEQLCRGAALIHPTILTGAASPPPGVWCDSHRLLSPRVVGHVSVRTH